MRQKRSHSGKVLFSTLMITVSMMTMMITTITIMIKNMTTMMITTTTIMIKNMTTMMIMTTTGMTTMQVMITENLIPTLGYLRIMQKLGST